MHCWQRRVTDWQKFLIVANGTAVHAISISRLRSCSIRGFEVQTAFFRATHRKKSHDGRTGALVDIPHFPFSVALKIHLRCSNVEYTDAIFFYTNNFHLEECTDTKQRALSSISILLQFLQNNNSIVIYMWVISIQSVHFFLGGGRTLSIICNWIE
jgi:hypothetical protein